MRRRAIDNACQTISPPGSASGDDGEEEIAAHLSRVAVSGLDLIPGQATLGRMGANRSFSFRTIEQYSGVTTCCRKKERGRSTGLEIVRRLRCEAPHYFMSGIALVSRRFFVTFFRRL